MRLDTIIPPETAMRTKILLPNNEKNTLREFYLVIATLAAHEYFAFGCGSLFA